jgi:hypothetical protein
VKVGRNCRLGWRRNLTYTTGQLATCIEIIFWYLEEVLFRLAAIYFLKKLYIVKSILYNIEETYTNAYYKCCGATIVPKCPMPCLSADIYSTVNSLDNI